MAAGPITQLADVVVPEIFNGYVQQQTEEKSRIITSGAAVSSPQLSGLLAGGGVTFNMPSMRDLDNDEENISSDDAADEYTGDSNDSTPKKTGSANELAVRLSRNQSWSSADLAADLAGIDPMASIADRVSTYWARRVQAAFVATMRGVFADNAAAPVGSEHTVDDLTNDVSGTAYSKGVTDFSGAAFLDAAVTMGDSMEDLGLVLVHSIVYNRMLKDKLIEFVQESEVSPRVPTFLGRAVVVDDGMPAANGVFETWMFGRGAVRFGQAAPKVPTETERKPGSGQGGGSEVLYNRVIWAMHPNGHKYAGTPANGGPSNAATADNLANADSWQRVYSERKQIKIARLVTRES